MNNSHKLLTELYQQQVLQEEDLRKAGLKQLADYYPRIHAKIAEYVKVQDNLMANLNKLEELSKDPEFQKFATELYEKWTDLDWEQGSLGNPEYEEFLNAASLISHDNMIDYIKGISISPLD